MEQLVCWIGNSVDILISFLHIASSFLIWQIALLRLLNLTFESYGGLFQVWRFLITFADVLELWPFTLDEFVQAFHDYVSQSGHCIDFVLSL